jgi:outer membrane protein W
VLIINYKLKLKIMKKLIILVAILVALGMSKVNAQGFEKGQLMIGPTIGLSYGLAFGATGDYGLSDNWSIGGEVMYTSRKTAYFANDYSETLIGILIDGGYHFMPNEQFDPYLKGGLGYFVWSNDLPVGGAASGIGFILQAGARYYLSDKMALRASIGFPYYVGVGIDFKL